MCSWEWCPIKEKCYRHTAQRSDYQLVFTDPPIEDGKCEYLWGNNNFNIKKDRHD